MRLAKKFEALVRSDDRFEVPAVRYLGMVVFRLKGDNELTEKLLKTLNSTGKLHCVPASLKGRYVIRFTVTATHTTLDDISRDWTIIRAVASEVLSDTTSEQHKAKVFLKDTKKNPDFGTSLLLANSPMTPKIVNGSFAAIFDNNDVLYEFAKKLQQLKLDVQESPGKAMRRRIKGMLMAGKQYSLDSRMDLVTSLVHTTRPADTMPTMMEASDEAHHYHDTGVQTENGQSPSRVRSKSVDECVTTPDLKALHLDEAIDEDDDETSSPEAEVNQRSQVINGKMTYYVCQKCGSTVSVQ